VAVGAMGVAIAASFLLRPTWGVGGLALANAIGVTVEVVTLLLILHHRFNVAPTSPDVFIISLDESEGLD
jgi:peptidoglycan biosynthesis protein MviN/MurJ (putative lipid II flippase)